MGIQVSKHGSCVVCSASFILNIVVDYFINIYNMTDTPKTRAAKTRVEDEGLIQLVIERILVTEEFMSILMNKISEAGSKSIENTTKTYNETVGQLHEKVNN